MCVAHRRELVVLQGHQRQLSFGGFEGHPEQNPQALPVLAKSTEGGEEHRHFTGDKGLKTKQGG